ncbi:MAG: hypothetical protein MO852_15095 [Candidatus Devosia euplotis]|nr:hypothetical protein [Candidatus Devosia euplotis]
MVATVNGKTVEPVALNIVAEPVIAPPPAVYTVIQTTQDRKLSRSVLHAVAPLPQKIEFPALLPDLAKGHVQRRGLFVWSFPARRRQVSRHGWT